jgi:hypothetical protein
MFNLTLQDHLHLTFTEILQRRDAHAAKALTRARWSRRLRAAEAILISGVSIAATGVAFGRGPRFAIAAAVLAAIALIVLVVQLSFELDASARAHADSSAQLWALRERYRTLLSDLHDGALTVAEARARRDKLLDELRAIYDTTPVIALEDTPAAPPSPLNTLGFSPKDVTTEAQSVR